MYFLCKHDLRRNLHINKLNKALVQIKISCLLVIATFKLLKIYRSIQFVADRNERDNKILYWVQRTRRAKSDGSNMCIHIVLYTYIYSYVYIWVKECVYVSVVRIAKSKNSQTNSRQCICFASVSRQICWQSFVLSANDACLMFLFL